MGNFLEELLEQLETAPSEASRLYVAKRFDEQAKAKLAESQAEARITNDLVLRAAREAAKSEPGCYYARSLDSYESFEKLAEERGSEELAAVELVEAGIMHIAWILAVNRDDRDADRELGFKIAALRANMLGTKGIGKDTLVKLLTQSKGLAHARIEYGLAWLRASGVYDTLINEARCLQHSLKAQLVRLRAGLNGHIDPTEIAKCLNLPKPKKPRTRKPKDSLNAEAKGEIDVSAAE